MNKIDRIKELVDLLNKASSAYYTYDKPIMSDKSYDELYDELESLEAETGLILSTSVTQKVQGEVLDGFNKVTHSKPMLSAAKTKDVEEIKRFVGNKEFYCSYKLDGLTLVCSWENGALKQAVTRGTGLIGEDVTAQAKMISNLPLKIPYTGYLELRGECVMSWDAFKPFEEEYSHPRNAAAGGLRNLDTNITKQRNLSYVVFECVHGIDEDHKIDQLDKLESMGFETVGLCRADVEHCIEMMPSDIYEYPVDGLIFELSSNSLSKSLESTSHHEGCRMAFKWTDETYETELLDIEWTVGRTGTITPTAVFSPVEIDGATVERASVHNISVLTQLDLHIGDIIEVYKANMIIPQIHRNVSAESRINTDYIIIPSTCPVCGGVAEIKDTDNSKILICTNPDCAAKKLAQFTHFVSRNCMNIDGLSEKSLEVFIDKGYLKDFMDIYTLDAHRNKLIHLDGFGPKSVDKLLAAIDKSREVKLENFITALGIDGIGLSAAKTISKYCDGYWDRFLDLCDDHFDWTTLEDFGEITANNLNRYYDLHQNDMYWLGNEMNFIIPESIEIKENPFTNKSICVTGKLHSFTRNSINEKIVSLGAKAVGSVSSKTDYLITNEQSGSSKYKKAIDLNIPIITEDEFLEILGE